MELEKILIEHLKIDEKSSEIEKEKVLDENIKNFEDILTQMKSLKEKIRDNFFEKYRNQVKSNYPLLSPCKHPEYWLDVTINIDGEGIVVGIGDDGRFYCQAEYESHKNIGNTLLMHLMDVDILPQNNNNQIWKYYSNNKLDEFDEVYKLYEDVVNKINKEYLPQEKQISKLLTGLRKSENNENKWWVYNGLDLGVSFNDDTKTRIGIESEFKATKDNPTGIFKIYITTWRVSNYSPQECWENYKKEILEKYPITETDGYILDEKARNGRVYYYMPLIPFDGENESEIISKLTEYYEFIEKLAKGKKNL